MYRLLLEYLNSHSQLFHLLNCKVAFEHVGMNWEEHVVSDDELKRPTEITSSRGDYSKAKKELGWEPKVSFEELVKIMVDADLARVKEGKS